MMDTDAIYSAVCSYGTAKHHGWESDAEDTLSDIKRLLNEADEEHKSLLAENERLVDEVGSLKAARIAYAIEFPPIPDGDDAGLPAVDRIHENIRRLKAENAELKAKLTEKASLLRGCYAADHKQKQRIEELTSERDALREILEGVLKFDRGTSGRIIIEGWQEEVIRAALEKKHEGT